MHVRITELVTELVTEVFVEQPLAFPGSESVPRREEGTTGKYQHEVEGSPETKCWYFSVLPYSSQGTDII